MQIQGSNNKNFSCLKKFKSKNLKPIPLCDNAAELTKKKDKNNKKKRLQGYRQKHAGKQKEETLAM